MFDRCRPRASITPGLDLRGPRTPPPGDDPFARGLALQRVSTFESSIPSQVEPVGQDHRRGHERTRQRAASGLVHAGDAGEPLRRAARRSYRSRSRVNAAIPPVTGAR